MPRKGSRPRGSQAQERGLPEVRRARSLLHDRSVTIEVAGAGERRSARRKPDPEATRKLIMPTVLDGTEVVRPLPAPRGYGGWWRRLWRWIGDRLRGLLGGERPG